MILAFATLLVCQTVESDRLSGRDLAVANPVFAAIDRQVDLGPAPLLGLPLSAWAQMASPGSLFSPGGRLADSTRDVRAAEVGDIVTILVNDTASALAKGATNSSRKISASSKITGLIGATNPRLANL